MKERIYLVKVNGDVSLVKASSKAKAKNFVKKQVIAAMEISTGIASQDDLVRLASSGMLVKSVN